jgi:hypothetical protein
MGNGFRRNAMLFLAIPMLAGCEAVVVQSSGGSRILTPADMDRITVGSGGTAAAIAVAASALPPAAQASASSGTLSISGGGPIAGPPFLGFLSSNYATAQGAASATSGESAAIAGSSHIFVSGGGGGASVDATVSAMAARGENSQAQLTIGFYGLTIGHVDFAFGTAIASACCGPSLEAQVTASGQGAGPYSAELQSYPLSGVTGHAQSRLDIAVASSTLPLFPPGQTLTLITPHGSPE